MKICACLRFVIFIEVMGFKTVGNDVCGKDGVCACFNVAGGFLVNCSGRKLYVIPSRIPCNVSVLYLSRNHLKKVTKIDGQSMPNITTLEFNFNKIETIEEGVLATTSRLKNFSISHNRLRKIPGGLFKNNLHLQKMDLSLNQITSIPQEIFSRNVNLRKIYLNNNQIQNLSINIFKNNSDLLHIDLSKNRLTDLPDNLFSNNGRLQILFVHGNKLKMISQHQFRHIPDLKSLLLSNNALKSIPENCFHNLRHLQTLELSGNKLRDVHTNLTRNNVKLRQLYLSDNEIEHLPDTFLWHNRELENIQLSHNKMKRLPNNIFQYNVKLQFIMLSHNDLEEFPAHVLSSLRELRQLDLTENMLQKVPAGFVAKNVKLENLILSKNILEQIQEETFWNNKGLQTLKLSHNRINFLPENIFANNKNLTDLWLSHNELEKIPENVFKNNTELKKLDLSFNKLESIPNNLFINNRKLESLQLCSNNISKLPEDFLHFKESQQYLSICNNVIVNLTSAALRGLSSLIYLSAYGNRLSVLPIDLFSNISLDYIVYFSDNQLEEIPDGLFCSGICSHSVRWLFLQKNKLTTLTKDTFKGLNNLTHIFLHSNNIQVLEEGTFSGKGFRYIFMFSNNMQRISNRSFSSESIKEIQLYKNNIQVISDDTLAHINSTVKLYVDCYTFQEVPKLKQNMVMSCVNSEFPPRVILNVKLKESIRLSLIEDGFNCTKKTSTTECRPCRPGTIGDRINGCVRCPRGGFYQDDFGRLKCKTCNNGTFVNHSEGKSIETCELCPEGTDLTRHAGHRACFCKMKYARTNRFEGCSLCLEKGLNCSQDYKSLKTGYYWNWSFPGANATAYFNFVFHLQNDSLQYNVSSKQYTYKIPKVHECPQQYSCENKGSFTAENITGNCKYGYRGWLCSKCQSRFYSILNICIPCPDKIWIILELIAIFLMGIGLYVFILWQNKRHEKINRNERSLVDKISSQMKIVLGFYQVVGELFESFHDITWVGPLKFLGELIAFLKINVLRVIIRPHCYSEKLKINAKIQFIISLSFPVVMFVCFVFFYHIWKLYLKYRFRTTIIHVKEKLRNLREKLYTYSLLLLFITYPPTCDVIFKLYPGACKTFYIYGEDTTVNITLLRSDFDLDCEKLKIYQIFAYVATVIYVALFPCALLLLLRKHRVKVIADEIDDGNVNSSENQPEGTASERSHLIKHKYEESNIPVWIKFLCENYKPRFWYWEIIELARKVTQTVLVTLLGFEDALTKLLTIGISVLFLTLHAKLSPMTSPFEQRLQMFSLTAIFINVLIASVPIPQDYQAPISTILILMNMIIILVIAGEVMLFVIRFIKRNIAQCEKK